MNDIFVSYRRIDAPAIVGHLIDRLEARFGEGRVFRDLEAIDYGDDFGDVIHQALEQSKVILVVIGDDWLSVTNESGERRLDNAGDWVRQEVLKALEHDACVIPVLVEDTEMPSSSALPDGLKQLANLSAARLREDPDFDGDVERLCKSIERRLPGRRRQKPHILRNPISLGVAAVVLVAAAVWGVSQLLPRPDQSDVQVPRKIHFMGIGINSSPLIEIKFGEADIDYLRETLKGTNPDARLGEMVKLLGPDATRQRVIDEIRKMRARLKRDEVAIIAYAGIEHITDEFYLLTSDVDLNNLAETAISADDVFSEMPNTKGQVIFLLDVCRSARFGKALLQINPNIVTLASAGSTEFAYEDDPFDLKFRPSGGGAFTTALGRGLNGAADEDQDGLVTLPELARYAELETPKIAGLAGKQQHPESFGDLLPIVLASQDIED